MKTVQMDLARFLRLWPDEVENMEFESKLSCEIIKQRLLAIAKPINYWNYISEHQFLAKWNKNDSFYLMETGGIMSARPILPFIGKIEVRGNSTYIVGKFTLTKPAKILLTCFCGAVWILFLFICFLNSNFDIGRKVFIFIAVAVWSLFLYTIFRYVTSLFQKKEQRDVIEFIKKYLLDPA